MKFINILHTLKEKGVRKLASDNQLNSIYSLISTFKYQYFYKKNIFVGSKTQINNVGNIVISDNGRVDIAIGDLGIQHKSNITFINLRTTSTFKINGNVAIGRGTVIALAEKSILEIGDGTYITGNSKVICTKRIKIGRNCAISWGVQILDSDFHRFNCDEKEVSADIEIGDNVLICSNVSILKGVKIGSGSIIGANTVVIKDVPENSLVVGNPGIVKKNNVNWE